MGSYRNSCSGKTVQLQSLCESITDCHHSTPTYTPAGRLVIRSSNIKDGRMLLDDISFTDEVHFTQRTSRAKPEPGDLIITREAPMGEVCIIPEGVECCLGQRMVLIKPDLSKVDCHFLLYSLLSEYAQIQIGKSNGTGSIVSNLRIPLLKELLIPDVDIDTQKKVGNILSSLDKKIAINNKINTELEAMAKLIYDYWFVQFDFPDPNGKPYKSSGGKMVYNDALKREIPDGWEDKALSEIANITMGQSPSGTSYNDIGEGVVFFQGSTDFGYRFPLVRQYTTKPGLLAKSGKLLLSVRAPVGTLNIADNDCCIGRGLAALDSKHGADSFLFYVMLHFKQIFDRRNTAGTTFGSITKDDLFSLRLVYPTAEILAEYDNKVAVFNKKILNNHQQNQEMVEIRDWLHPMLMNGQVTVKDA